MLRRWLICLAFASWCFANTWAEYAEGHIGYFARLDPFRVVVMPVIALVVVLSVALACGWELCRRTGLTKRAILHIMFLLLCLVPVGFASGAMLRVLPSAVGNLVYARLFWPLCLAAGAVLLGFACLHPAQVSKLARNLLLCSWPVLLLAFAWDYELALGRHLGAYADGAPAPPLHSLPKIRVVWIIFDEMSQTIALGNRPADLALPNLDRMKGESVYATSAESPSAATITSLPSLIIGEKVLEAVPCGPANLSLRLSSRKNPIPWDRVANIFDAARGMGLDTALVGWYHPYGRVLNRSLTKYYWTAIGLPSGIEEPSAPQPLLDGMWSRVQLQFVHFPRVSHLPGVTPEVYQRQEKLRRFAFLSARAREVAADPTIGLALIHLPVPHTPPIFDRKSGTLTARGGTSYLDNMALADRELGALRRAIEDAGLWDSTAVVVSADHGWRVNRWRNSLGWTSRDEAVSHQDTSGVPFLVKLPKQNIGTIYSPGFNTLLTRRLILSILRGEIRDAASVESSIESADSQPPR